MSRNSLSQAVGDSLKPKFAISYLRVSTRGQAERGGGHDEGFSIPAQREANKRKAAELGAIVGKEFVDRGASAKSAERPEFQNMLKYIKENAGRIDYVIVHKVDRLARNREDDIAVTRLLKESGIQLVSTSEAIDESPSGMLLHGIMSAIAEFYSQNLANEVKKGLSEKVRNGGTVGRAPLGYLNIRRVDDRGREERTVIIDKERAPLVKMAYEEYATGEWSIDELKEYMNACGMTTRATPNMPSIPLHRSMMERILSNPYYKGTVVYEGVEYEGAHPKLVDEVLWQRVQDVMKSHAVGERKRQHPHFLKGSLYCRKCGHKMVVNYAKNRAGTVYPYFICGGRHGRHSSCDQKAVLISEVERGVERIYHGYSLPGEICESVRRNVAEALKAEEEKSSSIKDSLKRETGKLERKRKKLLEAHYADAIPLDLLKREQEQITRRMSEIKYELETYEQGDEKVRENLSKALELLHDCGVAYEAASEHVKRMFNQVLFEKIYVDSRAEVTCELAEPFRSLDSTIRAEKAAHSKKNEEVRKGDSLADFFGNNRHQSFLVNCWNNACLVDPTGLEPVTLRM